MKLVRFKMIQLSSAVFMAGMLFGYQNCAKVSFTSAANTKSVVDPVTQGSPAPTPPLEPSPAPSPATSPVPSPEPSPTPSPATSPVPSPEPSPTPSPATSPVPSPEPSPAPSPATSPAPSPGPSPCRDVLQEYDKNLRIIFMVDDSGSTFPNSGLPGTDPNYVYRKQSIQNFIAQYGAKSNFTYSFGRFGKSRSQFYEIPLNKFTTSFLNVFGNATNLQSALDYYVSITDHGGNTPYKAAFNAITNVVINDTPPAGYQTDYAVVFMSDGAPSDTSNPDDPIQTDADLAALVNNVIAAANVKDRKVSVNTVYFGPQTGVVDSGNGVTAEEAIQHLSNMAVVGDGQFINTNTIPPGQTFSIDSVVKVPGTICTQD